MKAKVWMPIGVVAAIAVAVITVVISSQKKPPGEQPPAVLIRNLKVGSVGMGNIPTLDPREAGTGLPIMIVWQIYDRLVDVGPEGQLEPMLATSWQADESYTEWTFQLRHGVHFYRRDGDHRGAEVTAEDVRASIESALKRPGYGRTLLGNLLVGAKDFIDGKASRISGIDLADGQLTLHLTRPFAYLPERLAVSFFCVMPAGQPAEDELPPIGSGPFYLAQWDRVGQRVVLKRNPHYWGQVTPDCPEELTFRVLESEASAIEEIRAGGVDWLEATSAILPLMSNQQRSGSKLVAESVPTTTIRLVALNMQRAPFANHPELGVALNLATDRRVLVEALGAGDPVGGPLPRQVLPDSPCWFEYQPEKAKEILSKLPAEAKRLEMLVQPGHEPRILAELLRQQWATVGITVDLRQGLADFFPRVIQGKYQMAIGYYGPFVASVDQYLWLYRANAQPAPNVMRFSDPDFESELDRALASNQAESRAHIVSALQTLKRNPPTVWLLRSPRIEVSRFALDVPRSSGTPLFWRATLPGHAVPAGD